MNIPQVAHLVACKVSGLPGHHNWARYSPAAFAVLAAEKRGSDSWS